MFSGCLGYFGAEGVGFRLGLKDFSSNGVGFRLALQAVGSKGIGFRFSPEAFGSNRTLFCEEALCEMHFRFHRTVWLIKILCNGAETEIVRNATFLTLYGPPLA